MFMITLKSINIDNKIIVIDFLKLKIKANDTKMLQ